MDRHDEEALEQLHRRQAALECALLDLAEMEARMDALEEAMATTCADFGILNAMVTVKLDRIEAQLDDAARTLDEAAKPPPE